MEKLLGDKTYGEIKLIFDNDIKECKLLRSDDENENIIFYET